MAKPKRLILLHPVSHTKMAPDSRPGDSLEAALLWSHSWYFSDQLFYADLAKTLEGSVDRTVIAGRGVIPDSATQTLPI